ncbi:LysM peptidoglycan-binding domain-containing protein [Cohnella caldifontis]|uniref:LysM peptidoglycan-binding domain-containing protein n=1 Tax=Cohnella caldifontis TaxID=3027471 RepID=UPI0023EB68F7|nr:LysM peptidoglycan-binding domain-containing protein [Cohnella sp. YIM B05605]
MARAVFFSLAFVLLLVGLSWAHTFASEEDVRPAAASEVVIYADTGDTLWKLASSVKKPSMDTRKAVHLLMKRNDLSNASLRSGQALIVPAEILP